MQKNKKYEFDNAPFMPGWWAEQLNQTDKLVAPQQKVNWNLKHAEYPATQDLSNVMMFGGGILNTFDFRSTF